MNSPKNMKLYNKIRSEAKRKFKVWPSAYASGWVVKEYKRQGGKYTGKKSQSVGISRWYKEKWINVCKLPRKVSCGRSKLSNKWKRNYPYCRPSIKVTSKTPRLASELSKKEILSRCIRKRRSPMKRILDGRKKIISIGKVCYETHPCQHDVVTNYGKKRMYLPDILKLVKKLKYTKFKHRK